MAKSAYVRARIETSLKNQAEEILASQGITMSAAINMMLRQVVIQNKLPFSFVPNAKTQAALDAMDRGEMPTMQFENPAKLFEHLGIAKKTD